MTKLRTFKELEEEMMSNSIKYEDLLDDCLLKDRLIEIRISVIKWINAGKSINDFFDIKKEELNNKYLRLKYE